MFVSVLEAGDAQPPSTGRRTCSRYDREFFGRVCRLRTTPVDYAVRQEPRATASIVSTVLKVTGVSAVGQEDGSASSDQERRELRGRSGAQWLGAGPKALTYALQLTAAMGAAVALAMVVVGAVHGSSKPHVTIKEDTNGREKRSARQAVRGKG